LTKKRTTPSKSVGRLGGVVEGRDLLSLFADNFFLDRGLEQWQSHSRAVIGRLGSGASAGVDVVNPQPHAVEPFGDNKLRASFFLVGHLGDRVKVTFTLTPEARTASRQPRSRVSSASSFAMRSKNIPNVSSSRAPKRFRSSRFSALIIGTGTPARVARRRMRSSILIEYDRPHPIARFLS
jgi:hypothetical protein